jgi:hypothetical protein
LEISLDSGLFGRLLEPVTKRIQWFAANSLFLRKQGIILPEQGIFRQNRETIRRGVGSVDSMAL